MAEIAEAEFDTFMEIENGFEAYVEEEKFDAQQVEYIKQKYEFVKPLEFIFDKIEKKNWNEEWENNLHPIIVDDQCLIRAEFHRIERGISSTQGYGRQVLCLVNKITKRCRA